MRSALTPEKLRELFRELARSAPPRGSYRVYLVGGGTAVLHGWRPASVDADLCSDDEVVFRDIQGIKERLNVNVEFARPEQFVPPLPGSPERHVFIEALGSVSFFHYDPYAQVLSKLVRGFERDLADAEAFVRSGMVIPERLVDLVRTIPSTAFARYPRISQASVLRTVEAFRRIHDQDRGPR